MGILVSLAQALAELLNPLEDLLLPLVVSRVLLQF